MPEQEQISLSRPVPGQSLTAEFGARPWQSPAQFSTVEDAMPFYLERLDNPEMIKELLAVIETGVPLSTLANSMQLGGVLNGVHSIDVGVLITPILIEIMKYLAEQTNTKYVLGDEKMEDVKPSEGVLESAIQEIQDSVPTMDAEQEDDEEMEEEPMGLMARRA